MTIKDLAKIAKVSQTAVSLALNNKPGVSDKTRKQIIELADKYGYNKKGINRKRIIFIKYMNNGLAVEKNGDFIAKLIDSMEKAASNLGYDLTIKNTLSVNFFQEIKGIDFSYYDGAIFLGTEADEKDIKAFKNINIPIVAVDNMFENKYIDSVVMNNWGGIKQAINFLTSLGHKNIGYIDSTVHFSNFDQRFKAYVYESERLKLERKYILKVTPNMEDAYIDTLNYLKKYSDKLPTAFIAANDTIAIGAIKAFKEYKLKIPDDISIIGFDDIPFCSILDKPLATIKVFKEKMGETAIKLLDERINNPSEEKIKVLSMTKLVKRESVTILK